MAVGFRSILILLGISSAPESPTTHRSRLKVSKPSLRVQDFSGKWVRLERAQKLRWSSHYGEDGSGFGYLTFNLSRKIGYDYRDIRHNYRVQLRKGISTVLFDGLIRKISESTGNPDQIEITVLGWNVLFGDDRFNRVFCDTRFTRWRPTETPSGSFRPDEFDVDLSNQIKFKPRRGVDYLAEDYTRVRYSLPFGETAVRIKFDYDVALPNAWPGRLEVHSGENEVLWSRASSGNGIGMDLGTRGSPDYLEVRFYVTAAGEDTAEDDTVYGLLGGVKIYGLYDTIDAGKIAQTLVTEVLSQSYHGLSTDVSRIQSPDFALEPAAFDGDLTLAEIMQWACKFGDGVGNPWAWGVEMNDQKRMFLEPVDLTTIQYVVSRESALQADVTGDVGESYQKAYGVYTDPQGEVYRTADRTDEEAMADLGDYARRQAIQVEGVTDEATVLAAVDLALSENAKPKVTASFTIRGNVFTRYLLPVPYDEIKAGRLVQVREFRAREATLTPNDFRTQWTTFQLVGVEIDQDARTARLIPAGDRAGFEKYMARLAQLRG